ncbi:MAG: PEP-CTERM sorting domain-containing protein [Sedimentisphaerales bacterium]|nr:PEP-CTERM sorting domain-containing protein [Sedimentisphaerales bacterium]
MGTKQHTFGMVKGKGTAFLGKVLAALLVLGTLPVAAEVVFYDGDFHLSTWQTSKQFWGNGGTIETIHAMGGGNPNAYLYVEHFLQPAGAYDSMVYGTHINTQAVYDPSTQGAITLVDFTIDYMNIYTTAGGMAFGLALKQDGTVYNAYRFLSWTDLGWRTKKDLAITESDFGLLVFQDHTFSIDNSQNPDFSASGSLIEFGLFTCNSHTGDDSPAFRYVGFDNWKVTVYPVPEPVTFALLALGGLALRSRRKSA